MVALSALGAAQVGVQGQGGGSQGMRRTGGGKECSVCLSEGEAVLYSRDTVGPLQSVTETSVTTGLLQVSAWFCYSVLITDSRTEPQD